MIGSENKKKIFLFTGHYPFGNGETFLEDEMKILDHLSQNITIISGERGIKSERRFLPKGASVICSRTRRYELDLLLLSVLQMLLPKTWKEKQFAYQILGYSGQKKEVNKQILISYYIAAVLKRTLSKIEVPDGTILYSYWMSSEAYFLADYKRKHPKVKCICRAHGSDCFIDKFYQPFRREILNNLDAVCPISEAGKEIIENRVLPYTSADHAKLSVERLGVIKASSVVNPPQSNGTFCLVTCSNVIPLKRLDLMIDALAMMRDYKIDWIHFGDGAMMRSIQQRAAEKLAGGNVTYKFAGQVAKETILNWYENHHVDLFVNCSDSEGIPVSIMEAFAHGIPAFARNVGGNSEIVSTGYNGILLSEKCTPIQLREAIVKMIELNQAEMIRLRDGAYQTYCEKYHAVKNYQEFYENLSRI